MKLTRRQFLAGLLSVGATIAVAGPLSQATPAQVNSAWKELLKDPWNFEVNEYGTIVEEDAEEPKIRGQVFSIFTGPMNTPERLIQSVECCWPLTTRFQQLTARELDRVRSELEDDTLTAAELKRLMYRANELDDELQGWSNWVLLDGHAGLPRFEREVTAWLASPIEWEDLEWFPPRSGAQGRAMAFFESLPNETLDDLGVVIVEGDHPGSTYFAAELRQPIEDANEMAEALELPFRFKVEGRDNG